MCRSTEEMSKSSGVGDTLTYPRARRPRPSGATCKCFEIETLPPARLPRAIDLITSHHKCILYTLLSCFIPLLIIIR